MTTRSSSVKAKSMLLRHDITKNVPVLPSFWFLLLIVSSCSHFLYVVALPIQQPMMINNVEFIATTTTMIVKASSSSSSSSIRGPMLLASLNENSVQNLEENNVPSQLKSKTTKSFQKDQVVRIVDANTIKLSKSGLVTLAGVKMPSSTSASTSFQFPECFSYSPTYKLRQLLPANTNVLIKKQVSSSSSSSSNNGGSNNGIPKIILVRADDSLVVNEAVVAAGFAKVQKVTTSNPNDDGNGDDEIFLDMLRLKELQEEAKSRRLGIFQQCNTNDNGSMQQKPTDKNDNMNGVNRNNNNNNNNRKQMSISTAPFLEAEFEPLDSVVETQWTDDGGRQVLRQNNRDDDKTQKAKKNPPTNPGDVKGCSDFATYEDAFRWYEYYQPYYGDVAKLDRDGDGVPCPGLPHTTNQQQYRMKVPSKSRGS